MEEKKAGGGEEKKRKGGMFDKKIEGKRRSVRGMEIKQEREIYIERGKEIADSTWF